jgi:hypothetical protein
MLAENHQLSDSSGGKIVLAEIVAGERYVILYFSTTNPGYW